MKILFKQKEESFLWYNIKCFCLLLLGFLLITSCFTPQSGLSTYQSKNVVKFSKKKNYRPNKGKNGPKYVRPGKRGELYHPAVTKETRKIKKSEIRRQRTGGN
jgi:hypothetical protein